MDQGNHSSGAGQAARLLTADELAERWRIKPAHVYRLTRDEAIPAVRLGRYYRYRLEAVEEFERQGGATTERVAA
jgi:excisionase family DNA binding protein